jgi:hypothetical protein
LRTSTGDDQALAAVAVGELADHQGVGDGGAVDRDLVGAGGEQAADVGFAADAAADGQRGEDLVGDAVDDIEEGLAALDGGGDVEQADLVGALAVVGAGGLDGVAGVAQAGEVDALDDAAVLDVEAGDDAALQHKRFSR